MQVIPELLELYEQVRENIDKPGGTVFKYDVIEENGLKLFAELMARTRRKGIANLFISCSSVATIHISPTTKYRYGFKVENKLDSLHQEGHYLLCMQVESELEKGNFIVLKTDDLGNTIQMFSVYDHKKTPYAITGITIDYDMDITDDLRRLSKLIAGELTNMAKRTSPSNFGALS